jgi:hypothetical protein
MADWSGLDFSGLGPLEPAPKKRGIGTAVNDTVIEFSNAAAGGVKAISDMVKPGNEFSQYLERNIKEGEEKQSTQIQLAKQKLAESLQTDELDEQAKGVWQYLKQNPGLAAAQAAGSFATPGAAIKGARGVAGALGLNKSRAGLGAGSFTGGMMSGGDAAGTAYDLTMNSPEQAHLPHEERHLLATSAARKASIAPAIYGAATGLMGAEAALARGASQGIIRTGLKEGLQEFGDEGITAYSGRMAASEYDSSINPMEGVFGQALLGGALGGVTGAGVGLATRSPRPLVDTSDPSNPANILGIRGGGQHPVVPGQAEIDKAFAEQQLPLFQAPVQPDLFPSTLPIPGDALAPPAAPATGTPGTAATTPTGAIEQEQPDPRKQLIQEVRQAFEQALTQTGVQNPNKGQVTRTVNSMLNGVTTKEELVAKINGEIAALQSTKRPNDLARAETMSNWRDNLMQVPEQQRLPLADQNSIPNITNSNQSSQQVVQTQPVQGELAISVPSSEGASEQAVQPQATQAELPLTTELAQASEEVSPLQATARELIAAVAQMQGTSGQRNHDMMMRLFVDEAPASQVAKEFGVSEERVKQLKKEYAIRMKAEAARRGITPESLQKTRATLPAEQELADELQPGQQPGAKLSQDDLASNGEYGEADVYQAGTAMQEREGSSSVLSDVSEDHRAWRSLSQAKGDVTKVSDEDIQNLIADSLDEKKAKANKVDNVLEFQKKLVAEAIRREKTRRAQRPDTDEVVDEEPTELSGDLTETQEKEDGLPAEEVEQQQEAPVPAQRKAGKQSPVERQAVPAQGTQQKPARVLRKKGAAPSPAAPKPSQEGPASTQEAKPETKEVSPLEAAGTAWDKGRAADHPRWSELTAEQQKTFMEFGEEHWTPEDVALEAAKIAKAKPATSAKQEANRSEGALAWNKHFKGVPSIPLFMDLPAELQQQWLELGPKDWDRTNAIDIVQSLEAGNIVKRSEAGLIPRIDEALKTPARVGTPAGAALVELQLARNEFVPRIWKHQQNLQEIRAGKQNDFTPKAIAFNEAEIVRLEKKLQAKLDAVEAAQRSEQQKPERTERVEAVRKELREFIGHLNPAKIQVVQSVDEIPRAIREAVERTGPLTKTQGFVHNGKAWLIASNIPEGHAKAVFLHEVGSHIGLENMLTPSELELVVDTIKEWMARNDGSLEFRVAQAAWARILQAQSTGGFNNMELLAYAIEEATLQGVNPSLDFRSEMGRWLSRVWLMFKKTLDKLGWHVKTKPTAQDLVDLAYGAARMQMVSRTQEMEGTKRSFIGYNSTTAQKPENIANFAAARLMESNGAPAPEIWRETGWARGGDGGWRMEINDQDAKLTDDISTLAKNFKAAKEGGLPAGVQLREILDHPKLFEAYPELGRVQVTFNGGFFDILQSTQGWFSHNNGNINITPYAKDPLSTLLHEVQHWIQEKEGFASGGDENAVKLDDLSALQKLKAQLNQQDEFATEPKDEEVVAAVDRLIAEHPIIKNWTKTIRESEKALVKNHAWWEAERDRLHREEDERIEARRRAREEWFAAHTKLSDEFFKTSWKDAEKREQLRAALEAHRAKRPDFYQLDVDKYDGVDKIYKEKKAEIRKRLDAQRKEFQEYLRELLDGANVGYELYRLIAGEVEARNTQKRQNFSDLERKLVTPAATEDVARENQVIVQRSERAEAALSALPKPAQPLFRGIWTTMKDLGKKGVYFSALTDDLADIARKTLPSVDKYLDAQHARQATRLKHEVEIDRVLQMYDHLPHEERGTHAGSVNAFIHDSTLSGKWGYKLTEQSDFQPDPEMKRRFDKLSPAGQQLVRAVFKHGHEMLKEKKASVRAAMEAEGAGPEDLARFESLLDIGGKKPYAPLKRHGEYVVLGHSKAMMDAKAAGDKKVIASLEADPNHNFVAFAETLAEAEAIRDKIKGRFEATGGGAVASQREFEGQFLGKNSDFFVSFSRLRKAIQDEGGDSKTIKAMDALLRDLYLTTLSEASARKSEIHRRGIPGSSKDMMRALATQGRADAHFLSTVKHNEAVMDAIDAMRKEAKKGDRQEGMRLLNEFLKRHAQSMEKGPGRIENAIKRATSFWMLSTSPAFYAQQASQTYVMSLPILAGKHGWWKSEKNIRKAYMELAPMLKGLGINDSMDFSKAPADVREMLTTLVNNGKIDVGIDVEMGTWAKEGSGSAAWSRADRTLRGLMVRMESINRTSAAIAAFRMEKMKQLADGKLENEASVAATKYAEKIVHMTHGSYDGFNTPRVLNSFPAARVITQFRRFQIIQLSLLVRLFQNSLKGADATERAVARRALMFTLGHSFLLTGAIGTPGVAAIAWLAGKLLLDDDEPDTEQTRELALRKAIGDDDIADLLIRGTPAAFGWDMSTRLGFTNTFSLLPFYQGDPATRKGYNELVVAALGPAFSLGGKFADGVGTMRSGEYYKGLEMMLPNGVANAMKGMRIAEDGVTLRNGDVVLTPDEVSLLAALGQGIGLPTTTVTERQFRQGVKTTYDTYYQSKTTEIKGDYLRAYRAGDAEGMSEARAEWTQLQESRQRNGYKREPLSTLLKAPQQAMKRERNTAGGVQFNQRNRQFVEGL